MEKLTLTPNVPVQIALKFPDGKLVEGRFGDQMLYTLTNNQVLYLDTDVAAKINMLEIRPREPFWICKRWTGKKGDGIQWDIYRLDGVCASASLATGIAATEIDAEIAFDRQHQVVPPMPPAPAVGRVIPARAAVPATAPAPAASEPPYNTNGNGTKPANRNGNGQGVPPDARPYNAAGIPTPMVKVGYDIALRRILRVAVSELATAHEQWSDAARQDLVSTLMIQAARDGMISWAPLTKEGD